MDALCEQCPIRPAFRDTLSCGRLPCLCQCVHVLRQAAPGNSCLARDTDLAGLGSKPRDLSELLLPFRCCLSPTWLNNRLGRILQHICPLSSRPTAPARCANPSRPTAPAPLGRCKHHHRYQPEQLPRTLFRKRVFRLPGPVVGLQ